MNMAEIGKCGLDLSNQVYSTPIVSEVGIIQSYHLSYTMKSLEAYDKL